MKKIHFLLLIFFLTVQIGYSQNDEFNTADLRRTAKIVGFKFAKKLKNKSQDYIMQFYSSVESNRGLLKQININSWGICDHYDVDNLDIYNYYYNSISRATYEKYCKELNALMLLDGTIKQLD